MKPSDFLRGRKNGTAKDKYSVRHGETLALLLALLIASGTALGLLIGRRVNQSIEKVWQPTLEERVRQTEKILYSEDSYFSPDTAYLAKLKALFYYGSEVPADAYDSADEYSYMLTTHLNILMNIRFGVQSGAVRSTYLMLEDQTAPYLIVSGWIRRNTELADSGWQAACLGMKNDYFLDWRKLYLSYTRGVDVITTYRRIVSRHWMTGEKTTGYLVINRDRNSVEDAVKEVLQPSEGVYLYNIEAGKGLYIGSDSPGSAAAEQIVAEHLASEGVWNGAVRGVRQQTGSNSVYYLVSQKNSSFLFLVVKEDTDLTGMLSNGYLLFVALLLVCCSIILAFGLINLRQYRNYGAGLRKVLMAAEHEDGNETGRFAGKSAADYDQIVNRLLSNTIDAVELETALQTEKDLRAELDILYGHVQINSHFLLNTMDSIYWSSVRSSGAESDESVMIENLCTILKYALDSSDLFTTLREETDCAQMYLEIQRIRKKMDLEVQWDIPERLLCAKMGKLTMQPILENCIQHGLRGSSRRLSIRVRAREENGILTIDISDSGVGMTRAEMQRMNRQFSLSSRVRTRHIGLSNVNRRIQVQYGGSCGLSLSRSEEGGLCVTMRLLFTEMK